MDLYLPLSIYKKFFQDIYFYLPEMREVDFYSGFCKSVGLPRLPTVAVFHIVVVSQP